VDTGRPDWLPTMEFVAALNASEARRGKPWLGPLDGMTLTLWYFEQKALRIKPGDLVKITGC
jgi:hypothetical protein